MFQDVQEEHRIIMASLLLKDPPIPILPREMPMGDARELGEEIGRELWGPGFEKDPDLPKS